MMQPPLTVLLLALTAACVPTGQLRPLAIEEHELAGPPSSDTGVFQPTEGSMESVLARHAEARAPSTVPDGEFVEGRFRMRATLGSRELMAVLGGASGEAGNFVVVYAAGRELYRIDAGMPSPITPLRGLWTYGDHWVLETVFVETEAVTGMLTVDGILICPGSGCDEAFGFQLLGGAPFYFVRRSGRIDLSYDGKLVPTAYDEVPHFGCCSASVLNPRGAEEMLAFFARKGARWYYVEAGLFDGR